MEGEVWDNIKPLHMPHWDSFQRRLWKSQTAWNVNFIAPALDQSQTPLHLQIQCVRSCLLKKRTLSDMAYAALVTSLSLLNQMKHQNHEMLKPFNGQIEPLLEKFTRLLDFLENDPPKHKEEIDPLERKITEVAYKVQDIIEFHITDQKTCSSKQPSSPPKEKNASWRVLATLQKFISSSSEHEKVPIDDGADQSSKALLELEKVTEEAGYLVEEAMKFKKSEGVEDLKIRTDNLSAGSPKRVPSGKTNMVGLDEDLLEMKYQLCGGSSRLQVIPIVGMGGIGKTTLASNIFYDPLIGEHFHCRAWTTITQNYTVQEAVQGLLNSMIPILEKSTQQAEERLYKSLKGRKYLVVLDDTWSRDIWDGIKRILPDDNTGSRVIITTRLEDVAVHANSYGNFHQIRFLNEDESWELLRKNVFLQEACPSELEEIGRRIARNCSGLPLSLVVVAGLLLKAERTRIHWEYIARDVSSAVAANDEHLSSSKILSLSYHHLPHHLKPCFLYLGSFPEDYEIPVFKLITMWVAEGFLKATVSKDLEQLAEEYLDDLVKRSLVLVTKKTYNGKFRLCGIHDLVRDLCIQKARDESFLLFVDGIEENIQSKRRLCFSESVAWYHFKNANNDSSSTVRSLFVSLYNGKMTDFTLLRVLDALQVFFESFPLEILSLFHLRYLSFSSGFIRQCTLPPGLLKLQNLETLIIRSSMSDRVVAVPFPIWKIPKLRHLIFPDIVLSIFPFPSGNDEEFLPLASLQTLNRVCNFRLTNEAVAMIPNLKKLKAIYTGEFMQISEYQLNNISLLLQLEVLNLKLNPSSNWWKDPHPVPFGLPSNLKKLTLSGTGISWKDMSLIGCLPNLEILKLRTMSVVGEEWEPVEGEFPLLKFLLMEWLDLKDWLAESSHFSCLEHLIIRHCSALESIPSGIGEIPTLLLIELHDSKRATDSAKRVLEEQRDLGNDVLQVRIGSILLREEDLSEAPSDASNSDAWNPRQDEEVPSIFEDLSTRINNPYVDFYFGTTSQLLLDEFSETEELSQSPFDAFNSDSETFWQDEEESAASSDVWRPYSDTDIDTDTNIYYLDEFRTDETIPDDAFEDLQRRFELLSSHITDMEELSTVAPAIHPPNDSLGRRLQRLRSPSTDLIEFSSDETIPDNALEDLQRRFELLISHNTDMEEFSTAEPVIHPPNDSLE